MCYLRIFLISILCVTATYAENDLTWPCFHGPQRNNISTETGLMQQWPDEGPELLWTNSEIGHGYSTVSIAKDKIFTAGMIDKQTYVSALSMEGKLIWQKLNGQSWEASEQQTWAVPYAGSRGTPTIDVNSNTVLPARRFEMYFHNL